MNNPNEIPVGNDKVLIYCEVVEGDGEIVLADRMTGEVLTTLADSPGGCIALSNALRDMAMELMLDELVTTVEKLEERLAALEEEEESKNEIHNP